MKDVVIISGARTPIGNFGGTLRDVMANDLGVVVANEAIKRAGIEPGQIGDVIFGNCLMRTDEINIARTILLKAGIPFTVPGFTIHRQCASGMQAIVSGMQQIQTGECDIVLAGGAESMSSAPYYIKGARWGLRLKHSELTDCVWEGLEEPLSKMIMGLTAENLSEKYNITREEQDEHSLISHQRASQAIKEGKFKDEIVPVPVPQKKGEPKIFDTDEHPRSDTSLEKLAALRPTFKPDGTVTAGNASGMNDGASAVILMSREKAQELGKKPLARIISHAVAGVEPELMGYGPVPAVKKAIEITGMKLEDIELIELNEAFAAQYLTCEKLLGLNKEITNVNGSGIALGHPVGSTGCRIVVTLIYEMKRRNLKKGLASLCVGGGMGKAMVIERE